MRRIGVAVLIAMALLPLAPASVATACSCVQSTPRQYGEKADRIFSGTATNAIGPLFPFSSVSPVWVDIAVDAVYKGDVPSSYRVTTAASGASCGYSFQRGVRYTVFLWPNQGNDAGLCRGTTEGGIDAAAYGLPDARAPTAAVAAPESIGVLAVSAGALILTFRELRRRRRVSAA